MFQKESFKSQILLKKRNLEILLFFFKSLICCFFNDFIYSMQKTNRFYSIISKYNNYNNLFSIKQSN